MLHPANVLSIVTELPAIVPMTWVSPSFCRTITVMTSLVALSFYGASQLKFHWVERYDKLLVGSVLCLVGILTYVFHDHEGEGGHSSYGEHHLHRKLVTL